MSTDQRLKLAFAFAILDMLETVCYVELTQILMDIPI